MKSSACIPLGIYILYHFTPGIFVKTAFKIYLNVTMPSVFQVSTNYLGNFANNLNLKGRFDFAGCLHYDRIYILTLVFF